MGRGAGCEPVGFVPGGLVSAVIPYGLRVQVNQPKGVNEPDRAKELEPVSGGLLRPRRCRCCAGSGAVFPNKTAPIKPGNRITRLSWY